MSWSEIKKAVNSDLEIPLNELIKKLKPPIMPYATATKDNVVPKDLQLIVNGFEQSRSGGN